MRSLRPTFCFLFALAFCVPSQLRGSDVLCIEDNGNITFGCSEIVDIARYVPNQPNEGITAPSECGPCTDLQIDWSATTKMANLDTPAIAPILLAAPPTELFELSASHATTSSIDTGPVTSQTLLLTSIRC